MKSEVDVDRLKKNFSYPHPFEEAVFETFVELDDKIGVPYANGKLPTSTVDDQRIAPAVDKLFEFTLGLRDYQEIVQRDVMEYIGSGGTEFNLAGMPGSGKSVMLASLLAKLGYKTLIIAHLSMLVEQLHSEFSENTTADVKVLTANDTELADINIATSQFISKNPMLWKKIKHGIGMIVVDEAESLSSITTMRIIQRAHAKYHIYISATFSRPADGRTEALYDFAGSKRFVLESNVNIAPTIITVKCEERFNAPTNKNFYVKAKGKFFAQQSITDKVIATTIASVHKGRPVLIAVDIIKVQEVYLTQLAEEGLTAGIINSKTPAKRRKEILQLFGDGEIDILIGAMTLNAGLSIPRITTIVRVSFPSVSTKNTQLVGRALRKYEGKEGAWFIDLLFSGVNSSKRIAAFRKEGWKISSTSWEKFKEKL